PAWWAQHGKGTGFVGNAHSLYLETLGGLGLFGFALLVSAFASAAIFAVRRARREPAESRDASAAATAGFIAFGVGAGVDWVWQLPVVAIVAFVLLGVALRSSGREQTPHRASRRRWSFAR